MFSEKLNGEEKLNAEKKRKWKLSKEKESQVRFFLSNWARRFNIFVTLSNYCGGYPRARGVRKIVHGFPRGDEFPTWSFEVARCVFVYTYSRPSLPSRGGTYSELVCMGINILLYIFILMYVYKYINIYIYRYIFSYKNIVGLL